MPEKICYGKCRRPWPDPELGFLVEGGDATKTRCAIDALTHKLEDIPRRRKRIIEKDLVQRGEISALSNKFGGYVAKGKTTRELALIDDEYSRSFPSDVANDEELLEAAGKLKQAEMYAAGLMKKPEETTVNREESSRLAKELGVTRKHEASERGPRTGTQHQKAILLVTQPFDKFLSSDYPYGTPVWVDGRIKRLAPDFEHPIPWVVGGVDIVIVSDWTNAVKGDKPFHSDEEFALWFEVRKKEAGFRKATRAEYEAWKQKQLAELKSQLDYSDQFCEQDEIAEEVEGASA